MTATRSLFVHSDGFYRRIIGCFSTQIGAFLQQWPMLLNWNSKKVCTHEELSWYGPARARTRQRARWIRWPDVPIEPEPVGKDLLQDLILVSWHADGTRIGKSSVDVIPFQLSRMPWIVRGSSNLLPQNRTMNHVQSRFICPICLFQDQTPFVR